MKLSEIKGDRVVDVVADIITPIALIAQDKESTELFKKEKCPEGVEPATFVMQRMQKCLPGLLKNHKSELIQIMAILAEKSVEEYTETLNMATFIGDVLDMLTDPIFRGLFS